MRTQSSPEVTGEKRESILIIDLPVAVSLILFYIGENMSQDIDETFKRIQAHKGVIGIIVINNDGIPIKSTMDNATSVHYASHIHSLASKTHAVIKEIDSTNDLRFIRIKSRKHEILVAPDHEYCMIVIQKDSN